MLFGGLFDGMVSHAVFTTDGIYVMYLRNSFTHYFWNKYSNADAFEMAAVVNDFEQQAAIWSEWHAYRCDVPKSTPQKFIEEINKWELEGLKVFKITLFVLTHHVAGKPITPGGECDTSCQEQHFMVLKQGHIENPKWSPQPYVLDCDHVQNVQPDFKQMWLLLLAAPLLH